MLKKMMVGGSAMALAALTAAPANATAAAAPSDRITVDVVAVNGSGCPRGTAAVTELPDNSAFTVSYSDYQYLPSLASHDSTVAHRVGLVLWRTLLTSSPA